MSLTLITGPANAAKAGAVLERFRAALARDPLLVVPTFTDVDHYRRELSAGGTVFGGDVATFNRLLREIAWKAGLGGRPLGRVARDRVVRAAVAEARLSVLAASAASPGFAAAAGDLFGELGRSLVSPARFTAALRAWAATGDGPGPGYAEELARLYGAYRRRLEALGRTDAEGHAWAALDALRSNPASWGERPVLLYGFDDLTPVELDAVETLVRHTVAEVVVALPAEPGRAALAGTAATVQTLIPLAAEVVELPDRSEHYAPGARPALHHLERSLFESGAECRSPNGAVRLLEAGGERAEAELVGAEVLELMREGVEPADIAVLVRGPAQPLFAQVLESYGVPVAAEQRMPLGRTRLGAGVLAAARAALGAGDARDLLTWLRTPGNPATGSSPIAPDELDARLRRDEVTDARVARAHWEAAGGRPLSELDALAAAAEEGPGALLDALEREATAIWTAPHRRRAAVLGVEQEADARAAGELRAAAGELRGLAAADPALLGGPGDVLEALAAVRVRTPGGTDYIGGVMLADPLAIRARRFRAVFVCGLQEGEFPRAAAPEPFLDDDERRALARASGLVLPMHEDVLARERTLFYACASRPEEVLFLSWRSADEEGDPQQHSPFLDDVRALFTDELFEQRGRRLLADVTWEPREAPTPLELRRALAARSPGPEPGPLRPPAAPAVLAALAARERESTAGLEAFAACGVRWLVERLLTPRRTEPDPEPMRRGALGHRALERTLTALRERTGSARITPASLPAAEEELGTALAALGARAGGGARARAALRALEVDLRRVLRLEAEAGAGLEPERLEWSFGGERDAEGALALDGVEVTGRVDRLDVDPAGGAAIVRDYKNKVAHPRARWAEEGRLQVALYLIAARELLGLEPVAGVYQPLGGRELAVRGLAREDAPGTYVTTDVADPGEFADALETARARAEEAARELHAGRIRPCPERCTPRGCAYPAICRAGEAAGDEDGDE
jgi:ATP-dependent helicase/DNAse subunit B